MELDYNVDDSEDIPKVRRNLRQSNAHQNNQNRGNYRILRAGN
jgi:hypothetical protein